MADATFIFMSLGSDGGGFEIRIVDGKVVVVPVPPWEARVRSEIFAAVNVLQIADTIQDDVVQRNFQVLAETTIKNRTQELVAYAEQLGHMGRSGYGQLAAAS